MCQLRTLSRFKDAEDNHANERPNKLWDCGVDIEDTEIETGEFSRRGDGFVWEAVVQAEEGGRGGCDGRSELDGVGHGEASVGGVCGRAAEAIDFYSEERIWSPRS